jgi:dihydropteroate synthase
MMGILNRTPDSFSDGGEHWDDDGALAHALQMAREGAAIIDVGGESTRPGAARVPAAEQCRRVLGIVRELRERLPGQITISIDTTLSEVAAAALDAGASMINDVSAGRDDAAMFALAGERRVPIVLMHMQGEPATMQQAPEYRNVVEEVRAFLLDRAARAHEAGVEREAVIIDPGIGFGKTREHNLALIANLDSLVATGYRVMLGASRKRFMGSICAETEFRTLVGATCATTALGVLAGVSIFRVHDVRANRQAAEVALALMGARNAPAAPYG